MSKEPGFGQTVRTKREELKWSQRKLAQIAKVSQSAVSNAESADSPQESATTPATVAKIARAFGIEPTDLVPDPKFWEDSPELLKASHNLQKPLGEGLPDDDHESIHHIAQFLGAAFDRERHSMLDTRILLELIERQPPGVRKLWEDEPLGYRAGELLLEGLALLRKNAQLPTPEALAIACAILGARRNPGKSE